MKKILVVVGGGRPNGNTNQLADAFIKGSVEVGHEVEKISLNKVEVKGCIGCNACRYGKPCVQKDAFIKALPPRTMFRYKLFLKISIISSFSSTL